ncbi:class I SAM-dependent methyltransferase [Anaerosacchariphilus polymeriproducens]|uniref:S-adenosyl-L-methionine-dependent methyltransferase n=1 Tax=Anaerosacchariphilus polymeriproducens TaxID=1812858 RepID=A0A371ATS8_9FIRM|nr:class I SAM-dependent methyltransferase [Anaerosacchariphilus polymeriproducens]RDU22973.1 SAM-dependent methyltransferase [Anaerosacchariphilus polymeriproducens]
MEEKSITARICAFSRAYHREKNIVRIFDDTIAKLLLTDEEYKMISQNMSYGINYFNPTFSGNDEEVLRWIVDNQLSPTPLCRAAFAEKSLKTVAGYGAKQYLILAAGYDTFAYRQPSWSKKMEIYEIDHPATASDKIERLRNAEVMIPQNVHYIKADFMMDNWETLLNEDVGFDKNKLSFCSMLGMTYYFSKQVFDKFIERISSIIPDNSTILFDYPDENYFSEKIGENKYAKLAAAANENMITCYSYKEMETLLAKHNFLIFEHLDSTEMTEQYISNYNEANPIHRMSAQNNVNYCMAVKK